MLNNIPNWGHFKRWEWNFLNTLGKRGLRLLWGASDWVRTRGPKPVAVEAANDLSSVAKPIDVQLARVDGPLNRDLVYAYFSCSSPNAYEL